MASWTQALSTALLVAGCSGPAIVRKPTLVAPIVVEQSVSLGWPTITLSTLAKTDDVIAVTTSNEHNVGVWLAANAAAMLQRQPLLDFRFTANASTQFDAFAASGAMTVGFVASMKRVALRADAALLGVLLPDGTLGPSADIVGECAAALAQGKTQLGYPGSTPAKTVAKLAALADAHAAKPRMVAIADVYDGYRLLTGATLTVPVPIGDAALALAGAAVAGLRTDYNTWQKRTLAVWPNVIELMAAGRLPTQLLRSAAQTQVLLRQTTQLAQQAQLAAALQLMMQTAWHAESVAESYRVLQHMRAGDVAAATDVLRQHRRTATDSRAVLFELTRPTPLPRTLDGTVSFHAASGLALTAWNAQTDAIVRSDAAQRSLLNLNSGPRPPEPGSPSFDDAVIAAVLPALLAEARASGLAEQARTLSTLHSPAGANPRAAELTRNMNATLPRWTLGYAATAAATRRELAPSLLVAIADEPSVLATDVLVRLDATPGLAPIRDDNPMLSFAASQLAASNSATLYALLALGVHWANDGTVERVDHDDSLDFAVQHAQLVARRNVAIGLRVTGTIATACKVAYARAVGLHREGSTANRVAALEAYWHASACAQTTTIVGQSASQPLTAGPVPP
ncbi:MAG: hypothetical protein KBG15_14560 [Kofleriaceae bacterium]|nr:hypothetical protein [Kofleriaceae bacterium]